jgi:biopolymer transport protein ExbB/TolQ
VDKISITPITLFLNADLTEKSVMLLLLLGSLWCWIIILESLISLWQFNQLIKSINSDPHQSLKKIYLEGYYAAQLDIHNETFGDKKARIHEALNRAGRNFANTLQGGLPNLAIISSVAPFIGLLGTVWGIMNSFSNIAEIQDTSLAVVAPGISQALAATAYGLAAAIPASFAYNKLGVWYSNLGQKLSDHLEAYTIVILKKMNKEENNGL